VSMFGVIAKVPRDREPREQETQSKIRRDTEDFVSLTTRGGVTSIHVAHRTSHTDDFDCLKDSAERLFATRAGCGTRKRRILLSPIAKRVVGQDGHSESRLFRFLVKLYHSFPVSQLL